MMKYMIIENKIGLKVIDMKEYTIGELLEIHEFYAERGFDIHVE